MVKRHFPSDTTDHVTFQAERKKRHSGSSSGSSLEEIIAVRNSGVFFF